MEGTEMDILSWIWNGYSSLTYNLSPAVFSFLLRANLLLLFAAIAAYIGRAQLGLSSPQFLAVLMVIGILIAISIPLDRLMEPSALRPWLTVILLLGFLFLPVIVAINAHPWQGSQKKILRITQITLAILFVLNLIFFGGQQ
jgi:ABC-type Na+ efflux pump permease subunit